MGIFESAHANTAYKQ